MLRGLSNVSAPSLEDICKNRSTGIGASGSADCIMKWFQVFLFLLLFIRTFFEILLTKKRQNFPSSVQIIAQQQQDQHQRQQPQLQRRRKKQ